MENKKIDVSFIWHCSNDPNNVIDYSTIVDSSFVKSYNMAAAIGFRLALRRLEHLGIIEMSDIDRQMNELDQEKWDELFKSYL